LHVVGGPVVAGNMLLVLNVTAQRDLEVSGVNPTSGDVAWSHPYSPSQITLGAAFAPVAVGSTALVLAPATALSNPVVYVEGVNVDTGKLLWKFKQPIDVSDAPMVCGDGQYFCFPAFSATSTTDLLTVDPATGVVVALLPGPFRNVGSAVPGAPNVTLLWQTDATTETLMQTSPAGARLWAHSVASLFGGSQYSTNFGYDFVVTNGVDIGTVGVNLVRNTEAVSQFRTVGIVATSGVVKWRAPGSVYCTGSLQFLAPLLTCNFTGKATLTPTSLKLSGVTLTLAGLSAGNGKTTWTKRVADVQNLAEGKNVAFSDASHLVVETLAKKWVLLDVKNGTVSKIPADETFWCEETPQYKVVAMQGEANSGSRVSEPVFVGCSETGTPVNTVPSTTPSSVGVEVGNEFIWPSSGGLRSSIT
jgi:outer membrane protein assembly factor BamB